MINEQPIAVLQLIDSLAAGGAERMSVNLANALAQEEGVRSFLCVTRQGGPLEATIDEAVETTILQKRSAFDPIALWHLVRFVRKHRIEIVHAHATSWFMAVQCKLLTGVKVIWHDHYGNAEHLEQRPTGVLKIASYFFDYVISANSALRDWAVTRLGTDPGQSVFLRNFADLSPTGKRPDLPGDDRHRIVCLANMRPQKDHPTLIEAFEKLIKENPQWHLLLVGKEWNDAYSKRVQSMIEDKKLSANIHLFGSRNDSADILLASTIGVLSSESEGLPVALLEYGLAGLPVVCTDVGECSEVLIDGECGKIVPPKEPDALVAALHALMNDPKSARRYAKRFHEHVKSHYAKEAVMQQILYIYQELVDA